MCTDESRSFVFLSKYAIGIEQESVRSVFERGSQRWSRRTENKRQASGSVYMEFTLRFAFLPGFGVAVTEDQWFFNTCYSLVQGKDTDI